jgi:hypothetical protein
MLSTIGECFSFVFNVSLNICIERLWFTEDLVCNLAGDNSDFHVTFGCNSTDWAFKMNSVENELVLMAVNS